MDSSILPRIGGAAVSPNTHNPWPSYSEIIDKSSPEHKDGKGDFLRIISSTQSDQIAISSMLAAGFDPHDMPYNEPYEAFRWACEEGNEAAVQWLLPKIKDIDSVTDTGFRAALSSLTGFHRASQAGHIGVARILIQAGANIEAEAGVGKTPLTLAARSISRLDIFTLISRHTTSS